MEQLPAKCRKVTPFTYWVTAPIHSYFSKERNSLRIKFNLGLESVIKQQQPNMRVVKLKEFWDSKDSNLVINDRITEMGMIAYWKAIDASFKFNSLRHEQFVARNTSGKQCSQLEMKDMPKERHVMDAPQSMVANKNSERHFRYDPLPDFFARHRNYEGIRMESREDLRRREERFSFRDDRIGHHSHNNRFLLPRVRSNNRF